ncbi:MAG: amino acid racemase [Candidatus Lokiarchaeota archaeon]|nr:amino acid racemase [Candidatus Lokiarchaeota archaeon]
MVKHIGIVACSAEGAALCYTTICIEAQEKLFKYRHPEITMHTPPFSDYMQHIWNGNWEEVAELMLTSTEIVAKAGADFAICPDNTIHQAYDLMISKSPIPWLHIADVVGEGAKQRKFKNLGILGTNYLMTSPVYSEALKKYRITCEIPEEKDRDRINRIIFEELVNGNFTEKSRLYFNKVIQKLKEKDCNAVVLGCTEIPLLVNPDDCPLPVLDSTRMLARAAITEALE